MRLIIAGHSCSHYRQRMLGEATARLGVRTIVIGPQQWGDEQHVSYQHKNFIFRTATISGPSSLYTFTFDNIGRTISGFRPAVIYCMEEPFTLFARDALKNAKEAGCPFVFFTWENRVGYRLSEAFDRIEQDVVRDADLIICGNKLAVQRMKNIGADTEKLRVLLQTGVDTDLFKPMSDVAKNYDVIYHGRMVREKGLPYLEDACRELQVSLLSIGGRGNYHIRYGQSWDWVNYKELPKYINSARVGVQIPFSYQGYQEQGNFSIAENMSCGNPVIASSNGSIPDNFEGSPVTIIHESDEAALKEKLAWLLTNEELRIRKGEESRQWVIEHLGLEAMGKRLLAILEELK